MAEDTKSEGIKITDRRPFDSSGARRTTPPSEPEPPEPPEPPPPPKTTAARPPDPSRSPREKPRPAEDPGHAEARAPSALADLALGLSSSFSLLVARLAQETEIYLGLAPYPGKDTPEPDLEAARAMIDMLSMLQEKTRGNLDLEESQFLENLLYSYRLEFVRRRSGGEAR